MGFILRYGEKGRCKPSLFVEMRKEYLEIIISENGKFPVYFPGTASILKFFHSVPPISWRVFIIHPICDRDLKKS